MFWLLLTLLAARMTDHADVLLYDRKSLENGSRGQVWTMVGSDLAVT